MGGVGVVTGEGNVGMLFRCCRSSRESDLLKSLCSTLVSLCCCSFLLWCMVAWQFSASEVVLPLSIRSLLYLANLIAALCA